MKFFNKKIREGDVYAIHTGVYAGEMLIFIKSSTVDHCFLSIPNMVNRIIPKIVFDHGLKNNIIKFVERVPGYVIKISTAQFEQNEESNNRREQSDSQNLLDSKDTSTEN